MYYFNEVIKPDVEVNEEKVKVPCIYASPERWTQVSKQGYLRDKKRQIIVPLIAFKRTSMSRNDNFSVDKLDANDPKLFYSFQKKYSQQNRFDKFSVQQNLIPGREYYNVAIPDYVTLTYEFIIWTSYIEQMNRIVEKVNYSDGSYWGEPGKMKFRTSIDSFTNATEIEGERLIKTNFTMTLNGYILPESYNNYNTTQKYLSPKKLIVRESTDTTLVDDTGRRVGLSSNAAEFGEETKDIFSINISNGLLFEQGTGVTLSNNGFSFDGSDNLTQEFSIGQPVGTSDSVQFNTLTANSVQIGTGTTVIADGSISSSDGTIEITGSTAITGSMTVVGDLTVTGSLVSQVFVTEITTQSIDFSQGSNEFGDTLDDSHEFS